MTHTQFWKHLGARSVLALLVIVSLAAGVFASTEKIIYSFAGDEDGEYIDTDLVVDGAGNIYGTTVSGGDFGTGTVWELSPSGSGWVHTVLYSFKGGDDGGQPYKGVTLDAQGNLYGTAVVGGSFTNCPEDGCGVVYRLTNSGGTWTESVIYKFKGGNDGYGPGSGLTFDQFGNLYGTTPTGGAFGAGILFQLKPQSDGTWKEKIVHTFTGGADGGFGSAGRLLLLGHAFYGVTTVGGVNGSGTVYELAKDNTSGKWILTTLYAFKGVPDAGFPYGGLVTDHSGNLYGTTYYDGAHNQGSVYRLHLSNGTWNETVLYSFKGGSDGDGSISNLVIDQAGNLYGTTSDGGAGCSCGTIFELSHRSGGGWGETVSYRFEGSPDAGFAYNGMVVDAAGNFYGATVHGGSANEGAIYQFTP